MTVSSTGPMITPIIPKAETPPMTPTNTASVDTGARLEISNGRTRLSETDTPVPQINIKIAPSHCDVAARKMAVGTHTMAAPPTGSSAKAAASTPNTTAEDNPTIAKPIPTSEPWTRAVKTSP